MEMLSRQLKRIVACSSTKGRRKDKQVRQEENLRVWSLVKHIRENGLIC